MNDQKKRQEDSKVLTSIEFVIAVHKEFEERGCEPELALRLTQATILDLRLYDIMLSLDTLVNVTDRT
jgi:hypothetical protein